MANINQQQYGTNKAFLLFGLSLDPTLSEWFTATARVSIKVEGNMDDVRFYNLHAQTLTEQFNTCLRQCFAPTEADKDELRRCAEKMRAVHGEAAVLGLPSTSGKKSEEDTAEAVALVREPLLLVGQHPASPVLQDGGCLFKPLPLSLSNNKNGLSETPS